ncbi:FAD-dependent oxidoreductase [Dysosmobacter sp.]|uniref:FAD-dependent oxidoreductase n=1 Tax=Dysosmobacter sp. TaxID=2591382 RepID=UPI002A856EF5|nr:FAD-dependent oxidoreductase [Dysosmobacter sp.]MDY3281384.1 FAD-dependent oxidoreductase [Dysosmobacter sp.]
MFDSLFSPITIGSMTLKNRLVTTAMESCYCDDNGVVTQRYIDYVTARARGGWGMLSTELTSVSKTGRAFYRCCELWDDKFIPGHRKVTEAVHANGSKICIQLAHGGRQTGFAVTGVQNVAPSAVPCPVRANNPADVPRELTVGEIQELVNDFARTARRAKEAGYDAIEIHGAHGYMIQQFFSPFSNKRTDQYGGSLRNRARFALEVIAAVRREVGEDFPLIYRLTTTEMMGAARLEIGDTRALAIMLEEAGINAINASVGSHSTAGFTPNVPAAVAHGYNLDYTEEIKKVVSIPVFGNGRINDPYIAEAVLRSGKADVIGMGRASLTDPEFPNKVREGRIDEIVTCVGCSQGCTGNIKRGSTPIECLVNPILGHEGEYTFQPAEKKKKVAVVGGGIAGCAAAIAARRRGHDVELFEKSDRLGGQFSLAAVPPTKQEYTTLIVWQENELNRLGVPVHCGAEFTKETAVEGRYDAVILATGAVPIIPRIEGVDLPEVMLANDVLNFTANPGRRVAVIGGGLVGAETAAFLSHQSREVVVLEMRDKIPTEGEPGPNYYMTRDFAVHNVELIPDATVKRITADSVIYEKNGVEQAVTGLNNTILAIGSRAYNPLESELAGVVEKVVVAGDAEQAVMSGEAGKNGRGLISHAHGFRAGYYI